MVHYANILWDYIVLRPLMVSHGYGFHGWHQPSCVWLYFTPGLIYSERARSQETCLGPAETHEDPQQPRAHNKLLQQLGQV